ncbi:exonuclease SbcC [Actinomycetospora lutea]|uniref:putative immunity protein n=1 Tax=Actinomycetospora lutea TaxID=663604 RepID=UPI002366E053|nr:exonuclease SbcC [Actinomycetospora lutea]MDD7938916.1 exonuclease SbcC [Actinomycetospora lutea]
MPAPDRIDLSLDEIRAVAGFAAACARPALSLVGDDPRPRVAVDTAQAFADGAPRTKALRDAAWDAHRAAQEDRDAGHPAGSEAARAAGHAAGAAFLHPLATATQVGHVLAAAAHAARALELTGDDDHLARCAALATPAVVAVLRRYPPAPGGRGRVGALMRALDGALRWGSGEGVR